MTRPVVAQDTEILYAALSGRMRDEDEDNGWALLIYLESMGQQLQVVDDLGRDDENGVAGWARLLDLDATDDVGLGYLAQFQGVQLLVGLDSTAQRIRIRGTDGRNRGKLSAIVAAAQQFLTGAKRVDLYERDGGDAYALRVRTYAAETPDSAAVLAALIAQKPAGIILTYEVASGMSYTQLDTAYTTYTVMKATNLTYDQLKANLP